MEVPLNQPQMTGLHDKSIPASAKARYVIMSMAGKVVYSCLSFIIMGCYFRFQEEIQCCDNHPSSLQAEEKAAVIFHGERLMPVESVYVLASPLNYS